MYRAFVQKRIAQLRARSGISAIEMSYAIEQNKGYISKIENCGALPSLDALFNICDFFGITPQEFFDESSALPSQLHELVEEGKKLSPEALDQIIGLMKTMNQK